MKEQEALRERQASSAVGIPASELPAAASPPNPTPRIKPSDEANFARAATIAARRGPPASLPTRPDPWAARRLQGERLNSQIVISARQRLARGLVKRHFKDLPMVDVTALLEADTRLKQAIKDIEQYSQPAVAERISDLQARYAQSHSEADFQLLRELRSWRPEDLDARQGAADNQREAAQQQRSSLMKPVFEALAAIATHHADGVETHERECAEELAYDHAPSPIVCDLRAFAAGHDQQILINLIIEFGKPQEQPATEAAPKGTEKGAKKRYA